VLIVDREIENAELRKSVKCTETIDSGLNAEKI